MDWTRAASLLFQCVDYIVGQAEGFAWTVGVTPLSRVSLLAGGVATYLGGIWLLTRLPASAKRAVSGSAAFKSLVSIHSLILCLLSLGMFLGGIAAYAGEYRATKDGAWLVCKEFADASVGPLYFVSYVYYLSKYLELLDTVILALKGKTLSLLHVFHHAVMPVQTWLWLEHRQSLQEIALLTNTLIHVIMYHYYFMSSLGKPPQWKKVVTQSQIIQFVFSFLMGAGFLSVRLRRSAPCSGEVSLMMNVCINAAFLTLFIQFYRKDNTKRRAGAKKKA